MTSAAQSGNAVSLHDQVYQALRKEILQNGEPALESSVLYNLVNGYTTAAFAVIDILKIASKVPDQTSFLDDLTIDIASLATNYPVLHPQLISLISSVYSLPQATTSRSAFLSSLSRSLGDLTQFHYAQLFEDDKRTPALVREYIVLHAFYARLLGAVGPVGIPKERISGLSDALFILSGAMEDEKTAHENPMVDLPAAAMYMIHSGETFYNESRKGTGQDLAAESPLWGNRGKLWKGKAGLSIERWDFWKIRFENYESDDAISGDTKELVKTAVRVMETFG